MDVIGTIKGVVGTVAPTLATALGGPLAGMATRAIVGALGLADDAGPPEIARALQGATPDQLLALKRADQEFAVRMRELDVDLERIMAGDKASARDMAAKTSIWPQGLLTSFFALTFGISLSMLLAGLAVFPKEYELTVGTMLGALISEMKGASQFWFGTNRDSAMKNDLLARSKPAD